MLYQLRKLSESDQHKMLNAPIWVTLLIACADHYITEAEIKKASEIVHIKTFSEQSDVRNLYRELDKDIKSAINNEIALMPEDGTERLQYLSNKLAELNHIFPKLDHAYALQFYNSLRTLAVHIARTEGGVLGVGKITRDEAAYLTLPMIEKP